MVNFDYFYNPEAAKPFFSKNYFSDKKLSFQVIEKGTILPRNEIYVNGVWTWGKGGIADVNGKYVKNSFINIRNEGRGVYTPPRINSTQLRNRYLS